MSEPAAPVTAEKDGRFFVPDAEECAALEAVYNELIEPFPPTAGKHISTSERQAKNLFGKTSLTYGEICFKPLFTAFRKIRDVYGGMVGSGGKFYDIGSGTGKAVFFAALVHAWDTCVGIELLSGLHEASLEMLSRWHSDEIRPKLPPHAVECPIHFIQDDITAYDWSDGDVVFANSTCFDEALMLSLATTADRMRLGSFMVTFTKRLPSFKWKVLESSLESMSWGPATVFIQQKVMA